MKIQHFLTIQTVLAFSISVSSWQAKAQGENRNGAEVIKKLDRNKDGALSKDEVPGNGWERLSKFDKNDDGKITPAEIGGVRAKQVGMDGQAPRASQRAQFFQRMDKNKDGKLAKSEVPEQIWEKLGRADQNKDDFVSKDELDMAQKYMQSRQQGGQKSAGGVAGVMSSFDENKDGKLVESEVSSGMWAKISKLDSDKDGSVSQAELGEAYQ